MRIRLVMCGLFAALLIHPAIAAAPGLQRLDSISLDGVERTWRIFVPDQYEEGKALPLVLNFHGTGSTPDRQSRLSAFEVLASEAGFLVAAPAGKFTRTRGGRLTWNVDLRQDGVDDVLFVREMIYEISEQFSVDPNRIYATGFSGGGRMSSRLACDLADLIAAIGPVAGVRFPEDCSPSRPVPVITFHARNDMVNHYEHQSDSPGYWRMGVEDAISGWVKNNQCASTPTVKPVSKMVNLVEYRNCQGGGDVVFYRSEDGGHTWPVAPFADVLEEPGSGLRDSETTATNLIWAFFKSHPFDGE
jgi:polyhydroxybutyrate depolymerase